MNTVLCKMEILQMSECCLHEQIGNVKTWKEFEDEVRGNEVEAIC